MLFKFRFLINFSVYLELGYLVVICSKAKVALPFMGFARLIPYVAWSSAAFDRPWINFSIVWINCRNCFQVTIFSGTGSNIGRFFSHAILVVLEKLFANFKNCSNSVETQGKVACFLGDRSFFISKCLYEGRKDIGDIYT